MICFKKCICREIKLKLVEPFLDTTGTVFDRRILLLEFIDNNGISTWSECVAEQFPGYNYETIDTAKIALKHYLLPLILGKKFHSPKEITKKFEIVRGYKMSKAACEMPLGHT